MQPIDWTRLAAERRQLTDALDEAQIQGRYDAWERRLLRKDARAEQQLDEELLALLVQIQRAF